MRKILIYGDINLNYRDGSAVWLQAIAQALTHTNSHVFVLLKADLRDTDLLKNLEQSGVNILTPLDSKISGFAGMGARQAAQRIAILDRRHSFDIILSRGFDIASHLAISGRFTGRLWPYLTEGPAFEFVKTEHQERLLARIGDESRRVFAQTEDARSILEANMPTATGKTLIMNPIIPDQALKRGEAKLQDSDRTDGELELVYAGKFARLWKTLEMTTIPDRLHHMGVQAHLHMIGDKFQLTDNDHEWLNQMKAVAKSRNDRITWHGGMQREAVFDHISRATLGLCWREPALDDSPEISTKMLEYAALGTPPILNRSAMHEALLGSEYPLFIEQHDVVATLRKAAEDHAAIFEAQRRAFAMAKHFSMRATTERFLEYFERAEGRTASGASPTHPPSSKKVVVAGHDFKFAADLLDMLQQRSDIELRIDQWTRLAVHEPSSSDQLADWADVVICEWAGPNAVYYSQRLRPEQRLLVRFHGFEIRGEWLKDIDIEQVDAFVFVSDFYRREVLHKTGWPEHKTTVLYNTVDKTDLLRPKDAAARFQIGLAGYVPMLKRPDRAVRLLRFLVAEDERYYLRIRGREPWNYPWEWNKPIQRDAYREFFSSIATDRKLKEHVIFEPFGPDMGSWFRRVGWMLSPSSRETFHLAPVEGMMSGAIPVVWERSGASEIFGREFVHSTTEAAANYILTNNHLTSYGQLSEESITRASKYDVSEARSRWIELIMADQGSPVALNGISILEGVSAPSNQAEATAKFYSDLNQSGFQDAYDAIKDSLDLLDADLRTEILQYATVLAWVQHPETVLPSRDQAPLFHSRKGHALVVGDEIAGVPSDYSVPYDLGELTGNFYVDVLKVADSVVRCAKRVRPALITASGELEGVFGALIAARRVGLPFIRGRVEVPAPDKRLGISFQGVYELLKSESDEASHFTISKPSRERNNAKSLDDLKMGLIADEFTAATVAAEMPTVMLDRYSWRDQISTVDAVLVESAWEGPDHQWFHGVAYHGEDEAENLWELLAYCKSHNIPTIFWNKEDPIHYRSFERAAGRCDHVFTTDADMLPKYAASDFNKAMTVSSLSFFAQPAIHNPLKTSSAWSNTVAFAGTFYGKRYAERSKELDMILSIAADEGLTIYDRQHDRPDSPYQFPDHLQRYSRGAVPYREMLELYKSHPVHINVNSVSDSPSMFSRRVVEIAASGSLVLSGRGEGLLQTLGDAFPVLRSKAEWADTLRLVMHDVQLRQRMVLEQFRTVISSHRADQALAIMLRTAGLEVNPRQLPKVGWITDEPEGVTWASEQSVQPSILTCDPVIKKLAEREGLETVFAVDAVAAGIQLIGRPSQRPSPEQNEDFALLSLCVDGDYFGTCSDGTEGLGFVRKGFGDKQFALWSSRLTNPDEAQAPFCFAEHPGQLE